MSTIKDVAKLAGVSIGTVSNYLNGSKHVMPGTAEKITSAIEALNYRPNTYAKNLRSNTSNEIGVVLSNTTEHYYAYLLEGMESEFRKAGFSLSLALTNDVPDIEVSAVNSLLGRGVIGVVVMSCLPNHEFYERLTDTPLVFIDRKPSFTEANYVSINHYETAWYLLSQLFENNYKKIALVAGPEQFSCELDYEQAYRDFYKSKKYPIDENLIRHIDMTKEEAFRSGITLFQDQKPDAVISTSHLLTNGLEQAAYFADVSLYHDVTVISIGEEKLSSAIKNKNRIVTMRPAYYLGTRAAKLLMNNVSSPLMFEKQQILLQDKIIGTKLFESAPNAYDYRQGSQDKIKVLFLDSPNAHGIIRTYTDFTRKTGIDVEVTLCNHEALFQKLLDKSYLSEFDVCMYDNPWLDVLVQNNLLTDISDFVSAESLTEDVFLPGLLEKAGLANDRCYGIPFLFGPQILLYRKDLFEDLEIGKMFKKKYGTKLHIPRTWFEFNVISSFFTQSVNPLSPVRYGTSFPAKTDVLLIPELLPRIWAYHAKIFDDDGSPLVTSQNFIKGISNFTEGFQYAPPQTLTNNVEDCIENFYNGDTAMLMSYASFIVDVNNNAKSKICGKIGYSSIPGNHSVLGSWGLAIPATNINPSAALKFLLWTSDSEMSKYFTILDGQSPLKSVYTNDELSAHFPWLPLIYQTYPSNIQRKAIKASNGSLISNTTYEALIYKAIIRILKEKLPIEDAMDLLYKELTALMKQRS